MAPVASAQSLYLLNAGYVYDKELLDKYAGLYRDARVESVDSSGMMQALDELTLEERERMIGLLQAADKVLRPFRCVADAKKFRPQELPALFTISPQAEFRRSVEQSQEVADALWSDVIGNLVEAGLADGYARLCFNYQNPLVRKLSTVKDSAVLRRSLQMLYVQALLLGHHPLSADEMKLLNEGLIELIERGLDRGAS
jgi:molecular chaperone HtpG